MSNTVYFDERVSDNVRRNRLFSGQLFVYSTRDTVLKFVQFARQMIEEAFAPQDPLTAQYYMPVERYAEILGKLKPEFIHHPESKKHLQAILADLDCDPDKTYFDVPKLRSSTSDAYLTAGIAYAWHPHRDTWYSAPRCQINWWMPVYELESENAMAFHPGYWNRAVRNNSEGYNYYEWNKLHRGETVTQYLKEDPRPLPRSLEPIELNPQIRLICPVGGMILFSGAQMHSSVPNTSGKTRFSIDFRIVNLDDVQAKHGAPLMDEACSGTTMRDYLRTSDLTRIPEPIVALYDDGTGGRGDLIYAP